MLFTGVDWHPVSLSYPAEITTLVDEFIRKTKKLSEIERLHQVALLVEKWKSKNLPLALLPALPKQHDYWYLGQLISLDKHVDIDGNPLTPYSMPINIELPFMNSKLWLGSKIWRNLSRQELEIKINLSTNKTIRFISLSEWLILNYNYPELTNEFATNFVHIDGYRKHVDGDLTGLIAGNQLFGGAAFIDSFWHDKCNPNIRPLLVRLNHQ